MALPALGIQLLAGLAGSMGGSGSSGYNLAAPGATEQAGEGAVLRNLPQLQNYVDAGPGQNEVSANLSTQNDLARMLQSFAQGGFLPGAQDFATAQQFANSAFAPQQTAINQQFQEEQLRANQLAARLGRPVNDPIIQSRLSQERMRSQERLGSEQSAFSSQFALSLPQQRLGYQGQLADLRSGLASQAMQNRQALIGLGSSLQQQGQQFRMGTAQRTAQQGGGLGGAISGLIGGIGATRGGGLMDFFSGGGNSGGPASSAGGGGSQLGIGNLNSMFGFNQPQASSPFGSSSMFGQFTGARQPAGGSSSRLPNFANIQTGVPAALSPNLNFGGPNLQNMLQGGQWGFGGSPGAGY